MKIKGTVLNPQPNRETVYIPRGEQILTLVVSGYPLGFSEDMQEKFPKPPVPKGFAKAQGRKGKAGKVLRDPATKKAILIDDYENVEYVKACAERGVRLAMWNLYYALAADPNIEFDAKLEDSAPEEFADSIYEEVKAAGFTMGEVEFIIDKAYELSSLTSQKVMEARDSFLSAQEEEEADGVYRLDSDEQSDTSSSEDASE